MRTKLTEIIDSKVWVTFDIVKEFLKIIKFKINLNLIYWNISTVRVLSRVNDFHCMEMVPEIYKSYIG